MIKKETKKVVKIPKVKTIPQLVSELDKYFSVYIRTRDIDEFGITKCFTCGKIAHWRTLQNGHYISRSFFGVRWDEKNCAPQCVRCNIYREGNKPEYTTKLIEKYGIGILEELNIKKNRHAKMERFVLEISFINL